ncbi:PREDICTED: thyrotropin-releasing hormone receptor-like [Priapulus caudatus]|uniref:Thyrotropin-releasing hormone receptor-like n=1 Tax=Priapulus caudatus TaxID=37621 RepID=A0ABM1ESK5_PRICU|nr:PREDICTED: thyrotropin-releasing hormone receptor-like [Priapulus caudatus]
MNCTDEMQTLKTNSLSLGDQLYQSVLCVMISCIVLSNSMVVISTRRFLPLQTRCNRIAVNIAIADLLIACSVAVMLVYDHLPVSKEDGTPQLVSCYIRTGAPFVVVVVTSASLVAIAVDRYVAVCHQGKYIRVVTQDRITIFMFISWMYSATLFIVPALATHHPTTCYLETFLTSYHLLVFAVHYVAFVVAAGAIFCSITMAVRKQVHAVQPMLRPGDFEVHVPGVMTAEELERLKQTAQIAQVYAVILVVTAVMTTPVVVLYTALSFKQCSSDEMLRGLAISCDMLLFCRSLVNPVIFALKYKEFNIAFRKLLCLLS